MVVVPWATVASADTLVPIVAVWSIVASRTAEGVTACGVVAMSSVACACIPRNVAALLSVGYAGAT